MPATGVTDVVLDVAAVSPTSNSVIKLYKDGTSRPLASNLNAITGNRVSNTAIVAVGSTGKVRIHNGSGTTPIVVDITGYFTDADGAGGYTSVDPTRVLDTRYGPGATTPIGSGATLTLTLDPELVPTDATAVFGNLTVVNPANTGYLKIGSDVDSWYGSSLDFSPARISAAGVFADLTPGQPLKIKNSAASSVNVIFDLQGYVVPTSGGAYVPEPRRLLDTRTSGGAIPAGGYVTVPTTTTLTTGPESAAVNIIAVSPSGSGYVRSWASGEDEPEATSNVTFAAGQTVSSLAIVSIGESDAITVRNHGTTPLHIVVDLQGWFTPSFVDDDPEEYYDAAEEDLTGTEIGEAGDEATLDDTNTPTTARFAPTGSVANARTVPFYTRSDNPHMSMNYDGAMVVSVHAWWVTADAQLRQYKARVTLDIQWLGSDRRWHTVETKKKTMYQGGGSSRRVNAREVCSNVYYSNYWRARTDVDVLGVVDDSRKYYSDVKYLECTP